QRGNTGPATTRPPFRPAIWRAPWPGILDNACCGKNCTRWRGARTRRTRPHGPGRGQHSTGTMTEHRLEVADVFRTYESDFFAKWGHVLGPHRRKAFEAIRDCRKAALGGHVDECDECGHRAISYNSCRNRHCPKCQAMARAKWLAEREAELLPVPYFHVVFTVPQNIGGLALQNAREI